MAFFDTTPTGRILNRLAKDIDDTDNFLTWLVENASRNVLRVIGSIITIAITLPWFLIALVPLFVLFIFLNKIYRNAVREMKRLDNITRSPILTQVSATIQGLISLRAYRAQKTFISRFKQHVDSNTLTFYYFNMMMRWFSTRLELMCTGLVIATCVVAIFMKGTVPTALLGLCLTFTFRVSLYHVLDQICHSIKQ